MSQTSGFSPSRCSAFHSGKMSLERAPELGRNPVALTVKLPAIKKASTDLIAQGLRNLYRKGEFTDVRLCCAEQNFLAHRVVLASKSVVFKEGLAVPAGGSPQVGADGRAEIRLADVANPEAVKFMLDYMYELDTEIEEDYNPRTQEINKDVLLLAQNFKLAGLSDRAVQWLTKDISTGNVVEVLSICENFHLDLLRERIIEQLACNKKALAEVASSPEIMKHPRLMQSLLQQAASVCTDQPSPPRKKGRNN